MTIDTNKVYEVLDNAKTAFEALSSTLREVIGQVKDMAEENQRLNDANIRLSEDNARQRDHIASLDTELWDARRTMRDFETAKTSAENMVEGLRRELDAAKAECVKLREIILNVASLADPVVNPKAPEVAKAPEAPTQHMDHGASHGYNEPRF